MYTALAVYGSFVTYPSFNSISDLHASLDSNKIKCRASGEMSFECTKEKIIFFYSYSHFWQQFRANLVWVDNHTHKVCGADTSTRTSSLLAESNSMNISFTE